MQAWPRGQISPDLVSLFTYGQDGSVKPTGTEMAEGGGLFGEGIQRAPIEKVLGGDILAARVFYR